MLAVIVCAGVCSCAKKDDSPEKQVIYYSIPYEPETLDPQIADDSCERLIITNVFEGLVRLGKDGSIVPGAAQSWEVSADGLSYTFVLRKGLKWSNGSELPARDFVYGIERAISPDTNSPIADTLFCIKNARQIHDKKADISELGISAPDNTTVKIELESPEADFLEILTTAPAMPCNKKFFESSGGQYGRTDEKIICNGAFMLDKGDWIENSSIYLTRNPAYCGNNKPVPAGVSLSIGKKFDNMCDAIISGDTDCGAISRRDIDKAKDEKLNITSFEDTLWGISFNCGNDILRHTEIRQSLCSFIDRSYLTKDIPDHCSEAGCIIPDTAVIEGKQYRKIAGDITYTKQSEPQKLLQRGLHEADLTLMPNMTILCSDDEQVQSLVNDLIEVWNKNTGAYFNKKPVPEETLRERISSGAYQIAIAPLDVSSRSPLPTISAFTSASQSAPSVFSSEEYDSLVNSIHDDLSVSSIATVKQCEQYILSNAVFYPLFTEYRYCASASNIKNILFRSYDYDIDFFFAEKNVE